MARAEHPRECREAVQGRIPWNSAGDTRWAPENVERLCRGGRGDQPAKCFEKLMSGTINWGGGTKWEWENAVSLCHGSQDHRATIGCFEGQIRSGATWQKAIPVCGPETLVPPNQMETCSSAVQGKIPWNAQGDTRWAAANIERLCTGGRGDEPARCFERLMSGKINWGGGTKWEWENAVSLCRGSQDNRATIGCFEGQIRSGATWQKAIPMCAALSAQQPVPQPVDPMQSCRNALQGKVRWNAQGDTNWAPANLDKLCAGGNGEEPARCFERLMSGTISWGGGTQWQWENALNLCKGSRDARATIRCFEGQVRAGIGWQAGIPACAAK